MGKKYRSAKKYAVAVNAEGKFFRINEGVILSISHVDNPADATLVEPIKGEALRGTEYHFSCRVQDALEGFHMVWVVIETQAIVWEATNEDGK